MSNIFEAAMKLFHLGSHFANDRVAFFSSGNKVLIGSCSDSQTQPQLNILGNVTNSFLTPSAYHETYRYVKQFMFSTSQNSGVVISQERGKAFCEMKARVHSCDRNLHILNKTARLEHRSFVELTHGSKDGQ